MMKLLFCLIVTLFLYAGSAHGAPFASDSVLGFGKKDNVAAIFEYAPDGTLLQTIKYTGYEYALQGRLDGTGSLVAVTMTQTINSVTYKVCVAINANGEVIDATVYNTEIASECIIDGNDVWVNAFINGIIYAPRRSNSNPVGNIVSGSTIVLVSQLVGTTLYATDLTPALRVMSPIAKTVGGGSFSTVTGFSSNSMFGFDGANTIYAVSTSKPVLKKYTFSGSTATLAYSVTATTVTTASDISALVIAIPKDESNTYMYFIHSVTLASTTTNIVRVTDTGAALTGEIKFSADPSIQSISPAPKPSCSDSAKNQDETDVDCGGSTCGACDDGKTCDVNGDCLSKVCSGGTCAVPSCIDNVLNQDETDVDCGGKECDGCGIGKKCEGNGDCASNACANQVCVPSCEDSIQNQDETDVDCGGSICSACTESKSCLKASDCFSNYCNDANKCAIPTCGDNAKNGDETDIDCGGPVCLPCNIDQSCNQDSDCTSNLCTSQICTAPPLAPVAPIAPPVTPPIDTPVDVPVTEPQTASPVANPPVAPKTPTGKKVSSAAALEAAVLCIGSIMVVNLM